MLHHVCAPPLTQVYEANVWGVLAVTQAVVPHMAERRQGKIINVSPVGKGCKSTEQQLYGHLSSADCGCEPVQVRACSFLRRLYTP